MILYDFMQKDAEKYNLENLYSDPPIIAKIPDKCTKQPFFKWSIQNKYAGYQQTLF